MLYSTSMVANEKNLFNVRTKICTLIFINIFPSVITSISIKPRHILHKILCELALPQTLKNIYPVEHHNISQKLT